MLLIILLGAIGSFGSMLIVALCAVIGLPVLAVVVALNPSDAEKAAQVAANDKYERQWYCYQCGTLFEREDERP